jgi:hypothetical protein
MGKDKGELEKNLENPDVVMHLTLKTKEGEFNLVTSNSVTGIYSKQGRLYWGRFQNPDQFEKGKGYKIYDVYDSIVACYCLNDSPYLKVCEIRQDKIKETEFRSPIEYLVDIGLARQKKNKIIIG